MSMRRWPGTPPRPACRPSCTPAAPRCGTPWTGIRRWCSRRPPRVRPAPESRPARPGWWTAGRPRRPWSPARPCWPRRTPAAGGPPWLTCPGCRCPARRSWLACCRPCCTAGPGRTRCGTPSRWARPPTRPWRSTWTATTCSPPRSPSSQPAELPLARRARARIPARAAGQAGRPARRGHDQRNASARHPRCALFAVASSDPRKTRYEPMMSTPVTRRTPPSR